MRKLFLPAAVAVAATVLASGLLAQEGPGGFQLPPQVMAKLKAWEKWNANHKHVSALQQTMMGLGQLEQGSRTKFTKAQARQILPILKAWRNKPKITDDQALTINKQLTAPLNEAQLKKLASIPQFGRGRGAGGSGSPPQGGPGGPSQGSQGGPRPGGPRGFDPSKIQIPDPQDYNPLNPDTNPFLKTMPQMKAMAQKGMSDFMAMLEARAK